MAVKSEPKTLFLHIGAPKTGSGAIQTVLSRNKNTLTSRGYYYLEGGPNHSELMSILFRDDQAAYRIGHLRLRSGQTTFCKHRENLKASVRRNIEKSSPRHIVVSAESLSGFFASEARNLVDFFSSLVEEIRVICYLREPQSWLASAIQQRLKWNGATLDEQFVSPDFDVLGRGLESFSSILGMERCTLRAYREQGEEFDVVNDFSEAIGVDHSFSLKERRRSNESISHRSAIVLSAINDICPPFTDGFHNPFRPYSVVKDIHLPGRRFGLPVETVESVLGRLIEQREKLNALLGRSEFKAPDTPKISISDWYGGEKESLCEFAKTFLLKGQLAQNEKALKHLIRATNTSYHEPSKSHEHLSNGAQLCTDQWSMHFFVTEAVKAKHPDIENFRHRAELMRRIKNPTIGDNPVILGNPLSRSPLEIRTL